MNVTTQTTLVQRTGVQADVWCSRVMHDVLDAIMNLNPKPDCRVMYDVLDAMINLSDLRVLPQKVRTHLGNQVQPQTRRNPG